MLPVSERVRLSLNCNLVWFCVVGLLMVMVGGVVSDVSSSIPSEVTFKVTLLELVIFTESLAMNWT